MLYYVKLTALSIKTISRTLKGIGDKNRLIFQLCFIVPKTKLYVCRILCENFIQIGQKMKKL